MTQPVEVPVPGIGTAEQSSAAVEAKHPGPFKDVFMLGGYQAAEIDFRADDPGVTLFHCHQQLHMDYSFMALFDYGKPT